MTPASEILCAEWAAILRYWTNAAASSFVGEIDSEDDWVLDREAFDSIKPLLQDADVDAVRTVLANFGAGMLHSLLVSLEQGPINVDGPQMQIVEVESGEPLSPGLTEKFMSAAMDAGVIT
jgi:hypothetical protein